MVLFEGLLLLSMLPHCIPYLFSASTNKKTNKLGILSCEYIEIQAQLAAILGLHRTNSRISVASVLRPLLPLQPIQLELCAQRPLTTNYNTVHWSLPLYLPVSPPSHVPPVFISYHPILVSCILVPTNTFDTSFIIKMYCSGI